MKPEHAGPRDRHLQPNQLRRQSVYLCLPIVFPIALFVTARFDGPTAETPALKRSLQASSPPASSECDISSPSCENSHAIKSGVLWNQILQ